MHDNIISAILARKMKLKRILNLKFLITMLRGYDLRNKLDVEVKHNVKAAQARQEAL